ncbi:MAG: DNA repair protein RecN [Bacteroidales bacterium]
MLTRLSVKNYALIESLEFCPGKGFNIITGETGAGKSILLGALGLVLGNRADSQALRNPNEKCVVEAEFKDLTPAINSLLQQQELDAGEELILRREILPNGKSRAFINDTPVNLNQLREIGDLLVDIHSQHETLLVNAAEFQLAVVDDFARNREQLIHYQKLFKKYKDTLARLNQLTEAENKSLAERDYHDFLLNELLEARLREGEQAELEQELETLSHAEEISLKIRLILNMLENEETGVIQALSSQVSEFHYLGKFKPTLTELAVRYESALVELKDIQHELERAAEEIHYDPTRLEEISNRLDVIFRLQKKHRVNSEEALLAIQEDLQQKMAHFDSLKDEIAQLTQECKELEDSLEQAAQELYKKRLEAIQPMQERLKETLQMLGMPDAEVKIEMGITETFTPTGKNVATFLFTANTGQEPRPVSKVASGGELSRLMLAIKSLISNKTLIPVIIFDEIDTGVSGGIADRTGKVMKRMAEAMQVIAITHIPQIAALGDHHFMVFKETTEQTTRSAIRKLSTPERIEVIAGMLSNQHITDASREAAKQLLSSGVNVS